MSYRIIQFFDHTTSQTDHEHENMSMPNIYLYVSQFDDDDSVDESVKNFFTIHSCSDQRLLESSSYEII